MDLRPSRLKWIAHKKYIFEGDKFGTYIENREKAFFCTFFTENRLFK